MKLDALYTVLKLAMYSTHWYFFEYIQISLEFAMKQNSCNLFVVFFEIFFDTVEPRYSAIEGTEKIRIKSRFALYRGQF